MAVLVIPPLSVTVIVLVPAVPAGTIRLYAKAPELLACVVAMAVPATEMLTEELAVKLLPVIVIEEPTVAVPVLKVMLPAVVNCAVPELAEASVALTV